MDVNCLGCGHMLRLGAAYDDYHGCIKCNICRALMEIQSEQGKLKAVSLQGKPPAESRGEQDNKSCKKG